MECILKRRIDDLRVRGFPRERIVKRVIKQCLSIGASSSRVRNVS